MIQACFPSLMPESSWRPPTSFPEISDTKWWSLDVETRDPYLTERGPGAIRKDSYIVGVAIHVDGFTGYYPVRHGLGANLAPNVVFSWLQDQAKHFSGELYGANLMYDLLCLHFEDVHFNDTVKVRDVQIAEPCIDEESQQGYSLEVLAKKYLGVGKNEDLLRRASEAFTQGYRDKSCRRPINLDPKKDLWQLPSEYVGAYAEADVDLPRRIYQKQTEILDREDLWQIFNLESSLTPILLKMKIRGVRVDLERAEKLKILLTKKIDDLSLEIRKLVDFDPNTDSSSDMLKAYNILHFAYPELNVASNLRKTEKGNPSFTADWYMSQTDPLSRLVAKVKKLSTLRDDFVVGDILKEQINGRIHASFHQLRQDNQGTRTGRFSSTNPNLQQTPARHNGCDSDCPDDCDAHLWGKRDPNWADEVRSLFIADAGEIFLKGDFSQQEPRLLVHFAHLCKLQGAAEAVAEFRKNPLTDYHSLTTRIVNEKSGKNFKRKRIKVVNLAISYGAGGKKLSAMLGIPLSECYEVLAAYHEALPFVKSLSTMCTNTAQVRGFILTLLKRRQRFSTWEPVAEKKEEREYHRAGLPRDKAEQMWPGRRLQRFGVHKALNRLLQSSGGDMLKEAMRVLYYEHKIIMGLTFHDEESGSIGDYEQAQIVKRVMETCTPLEIPVVCDARVGPSWGEAKREVHLNA